MLSEPVVSLGPLWGSLGPNMSSHMIPSWSQGSQNDPCMLSQGPTMLLQGYHIHHPCGIWPGMHMRAPVATQGPGDIPCLSLLHIYIHPCPPPSTRRRGLNLEVPSSRPVKMRSKSMSPSPLCSRLADSGICLRKIHALTARGLPWAACGDACGP